MGDPQAPLAVALSVLDAGGLLGEDGRLRDGIHLVSIGDHFDWGAPGDRPAAARDGHALLCWLAAHPPDQVTLLIGNHDLARVGELVHFDDARYRDALDEADLAYRAEPPSPKAEARFLARHPEIPTSECLARDFSGFSAAQREQVAGLLRDRRFRVGLAGGPGILITHAGITGDEVAALGLPPGVAPEQLAEELDRRLDEAVARWDGVSPFEIPGLHRPGDAARGESRGLFSHRPSNPEREPAELFEGPPRRRFDPRRLPPGITQVVGHSRDQKCRATLAPWVIGPPAAPGQPRGLVADGDSVRYSAGIPRADPAAARMIFVDGDMADCPPAHYQLLELQFLAST
jgi:hypothetical protein